MLFVAQLWKYNTGRLENKNGDWMYKGEKWILPNERQVQVIRNTTHGKVLKANLISSGMYFKIKNNCAQWKFISFKVH